MGVANVIQNFILYPSPYVFGMVASGASAFFNFIVALFFRHLLKNFEGTKVDSIDDLQKAIEDFK